MASGRKNYFRHSFSALDDPKCQKLIETKGFEGYGKFWALVELCCQQASDSPKTKFKVHMSSLRSRWQSNGKHAERMLEVLGKCQLLSWEVSDNIVQIKIPNLLKYLGKYQTKIEQNSPNKKKRKEIKRKEKKEKEETPLTQQEIDAALGEFVRIAEEQKDG